MGLRKGPGSDVTTPKAVEGLQDGDLPQPPIDPVEAADQTLKEMGAPASRHGVVTDLDELRKQIEADVTRKVMEKFGIEDDPQREEEDIGFSMFEKRLEVFEDPNNPLSERFHLHWINDEGDRVERMLRAGYAFVERSELAINNAHLVPLNKDLGERISQSVGTKASGEPMLAYLMKLPLDIYNKRKGREQIYNDQVDEAIRRGQVGNPGPKSYIPTHSPIEYDPRHPTLIQHKPPGARRTG